MRKEVLASKVWQCANSMRGSIDANDYKDLLFGLLFFKYLSERQINELEKGLWKPKNIEAIKLEDTEIMEQVKSLVDYAIPYENLFSQWLEKGRDFSIADVVDSVDIFDKNISPEYKKVYGGIFKTFQLTISKLGLSTGEKTRLLKELVNIVATIPSQSEDKGDALGFIYEFLMKRFAAGAGASAGEFYTPEHVSILMAKIIAYHLRDRGQISIYDPTSGSGSLLLHIGEEFKKYVKMDKKVKYYAQEKMSSTYNLCRMNLIMRDVETDNIETNNADTLENDWPPKPDSLIKEPLLVDAIAANPPYSARWNIKEKETDPRFQYGIAPQNKADYAFLEHGLYHMNENGIMTIVFPHGVLFRGGAEGMIRKNLIENNLIDTVIGLPGDMFYGTSIPTIIMVLKRNKSDDKVLFIDASKEFEKQKKNELTEANIKKIFDAYVEREDKTDFAALVNKEELIANDYNLNIPRYVSSTSDNNKAKDLLSLMEGLLSEEELSEFDEYWNAFPTLKEQLYENTDKEGYVKAKDIDLGEVIHNNKDVIKHKENVHKILKDVKDDLRVLLIDNCESMSSDVILEKLIDSIYVKLENMPLINKYKVYDLIYKTFKNIKSDLEFIRDKKNKVVACRSLHEKEDDEKDKKYPKSKKTVRTGEIISIESIWERFFKQDKDDIDGLIFMRESLKEQKKELLENIPEDVMETLLEYGVITGKKDKIQPKNLVKADKDGAVNDEVKNIVNEWEEIVNSEKTLTCVDKEIADFIKISEEKLLNLTESECNDLLEDKWVSHLVNELDKLADIPIDYLKKRLNEINKGYENSGIELNNQIKDVNNSLIEAIKDLEYEADTVGILNSFIKFLQF